MINNFPEDFEEKRAIGENDDYICELIRKDLIKELIVYVNKNNYSLNSHIKPSIYETNPFLIGKNTNLIEYALFFGSIQVFNYLLQNKVSLISSAWLYAIHGENSEIIHYLEDKHIEPPKYLDNVANYFLESIICHHNNVANYILNNYVQDEEVFLSNLLVQLLENYNFNFLSIKLIEVSSFFLLCQYDYYYFINILLKEKNIDINEFTKIEPNKNKTYLYVAVENENIDVCRLLLSYEKVDVNIGYKFHLIKESKENK